MKTVVTVLILALTGFFSVLFMMGWEEEQKLYTVKSDEPIPEVPDMATGLRNGKVDERPELFQQEPATVPLPEPEAFEFSTPDLTERTAMFDVVGLQFPLPVRYLAVDPGSAMRVAEFQVPNTERGGQPASLVAFHFGEGQGGDLMGNVGRWRSQFTTADGSSPIVLFQRDEGSPLTVSRLTLEGTWNQSQMPGMNSSPQPFSDWALDAIVIEGGPEGTLFLRMTGPINVVREESDVLSNIAARVSLEGDSPTEDPVDSVADTSDGESDSDEQRLAMNIHGLSFAVPESWTIEEPSSSMRAAQLQLPGNGEIAFFYFGPDGGGTVEANLARWSGQVSGATPEQESYQQGDLTFHTVTATGTYSPSAMGMSRPEPQDNYTLFAAVIEGGPEGPLYLRLTGPAPTIESQQKRLDDFLSSIRTGPNS